MRTYNLQVLTKLSHHAIIADADGYEFACVWNAGEQCGETEVREQALQLARQMAAAPRLAGAVKRLLDWAEMLGGWDAPAWADAKALLDEIDGLLPEGWRHATATERAAGFARYQHDESGHQSDTWPEVTDD